MRSHGDASARGPLTMWDPWASAGTTPMPGTLPRNLAARQVNPQGMSDDGTDLWAGYQPTGSGAVPSTIFATRCQQTANGSSQTGFGLFPGLPQAGGGLHGGHRQGCGLPQGFGPGPYQGYGHGVPQQAYGGCGTPGYGGCVHLHQEAVELKYQEWLHQDLRCPRMDIHTYLMVEDEDNLAMV